VFPDVVPVPAGVVEDVFDEVDEPVVGLVGGWRAGVT
jgi:hypothetical protein